MSLANKTIKQLQLDIAARMSESYGTASGSESVINYNDFDRIQLTLISKFRSLFEEYIWANMAVYGTFTKPANSTGIVTDLATTVKRLENIIHVWPDSTLSRGSHPLKTLPRRLNPSQVTGNEIRFWIPDGTHILKTVPYTATGDLTVYYKVWPLADVYNETATLPLNSELLTLGTIADLLIDAGDNPNQAQKYMAQYNSLLITLQNAQETQDVPLNAYTHETHINDPGGVVGGIYSSDWW